MVTISELYRAAPARYPELRGQVAVVTGSSRGIGAAIAARLAREGMRLVVAGLDTAETENAAAALRGEGVEVLALPGDLSDDTLIDVLFERTQAAFGRIDLLVNNAADLHRVRASELDTALIDSQFAVNLRAPLILSVRAAKIMKSTGSGSIVNISSVGGLRPHLPGLPYDITKGALDALTRTLAVDLGEFGIRVNGIAPGFTPIRITPENRQYLYEAAANLPMQKPGRPEDISAAVAFLASPDAAYITGQTLYVDGGLTTQLHPPAHPI
jgi:NAD(P)-dependent dehydrogenase (short-subunit alcohol dehydrogenase family)